jgi:uncharacterized oxidoreductase
MQLSGNTILITGATSGIGHALATRFADLGNTVIATGRNEAQLVQLAAHSLLIQPFACDLAQPAERDKLVAYLRTNYPRLNVLVNNAGIQYNYDFANGGDLSDKIADEITLNLTVPALLVAQLLPLLLTQPTAAIVNVSSGLGLVPKRSAPVYCGTKAGLHLFTKALGYQLANSPVRVMEVIPPLVDTPMTAGRGKGKISPQQLVDEFMAGFARNQKEINIGKVKLLRLVQRISPRLADQLLRNS